MAEKMLTFELSKDSDQLEIHGNKEGLEHLTAIVLKLLHCKNQKEHSHLMTEAWGGYDLSSETHMKEGRLLNMVTIFYWPNESDTA